MAALKNFKKNIILASSSPRRKQLLSQLGLEFSIISPSFDENKFSLSTEPESVQKLSLYKAKSVCTKLIISALIIGADTVVIYEDKILGKPKSREEAFEMLKMLSGNTHHVITGIAVVDTDTGKEYTSYDITYVKFNKLSDTQINNYIDNMKPYDKAGAYGIQELPSEFVKEIDGEIDNVIGLPTKILIKMLHSIK